MLCQLLSEGSSFTTISQVMQDVLHSLLSSSCPLPLLKAVDGHVHVTCMYVQDEVERPWQS